MTNYRINVEKMRAMREEKGYKQSDVADAVGVTKSTYYQWEKGSHTPDAVTMFEICKLLGCSVEDLVEVCMNP